MTREDLKNYKYNQKWVKRQLEKYEEQRTMVLNITKTIDGMPHAKNKSNYSIENLLDQYDEILKILENDQKKQNEVIMQLRKLEEPYRTILTDKYILGMSLEEISVDVGYAYENICRMHGVALNKFDKLEICQ